MPAADGPDVDAVVREAILALFLVEGRPAPALGPTLRLDDDLGLSSLQVVALATGIGARLGRTDLEAALPGVRTIGDLARACGGAGPRAATPGVPGADDLLAVRRRAEARRSGRRA